MAMVNMLDAKTNLSKLVDAVESGADTEIIIARNGRPAARLVPVETARKPVVLGFCNGKYKIPEPDPELDAEIARMFGVEP